MQIVLTSHAKERMQRRRLRMQDIEATLAAPDKSVPQEDKLNYKFIKTINDRQYQVIGHYSSEEQKWIIISAWVRGEEDPPDYLWIVLTAPFRLIWWLIKNFFKLLGRLFRKLFGPKYKH